MARVWVDWLTAPQPRQGSLVDGFGGTDTDARRLRADLAAVRARYSDLP